MKALGLVVLEKKIFFMFSYCKSMGATCNNTQGGAFLDPRAMVGYTKYESSGPCGFREEDFFI